MKIVRVAHDVSEVPDSGGANITLDQFDVEGFLKDNEAKIVALSSASTAARIAALAAIGFNPLLYGATKLAAAFSDNSKEVAKSAATVTANRLLEELRKASEIVEVVSLDDARLRYPNTHNLSVGTYTHHPYDKKRLTRIEHYHQRLALEKDDELIVLLGKMGARSLRILQSSARRSSGGAGLEIDAILKGGGLNFKSTERKEGGRELVVQFEGGNVDIDIDVLRSSLWFSHDSKLNAILQSRLFSPNKITSYTLSNTYTETFDFDFDLAARFLVAEMDLRAEYSGLSREVRYFHVEFGERQ